MHGVTLAAVQGLYPLALRQQSAIEALQAEVMALRRQRFQPDALRR
jgi:hypothetical protein